MTESLFPP